MSNTGTFLNQENIIKKVFDATANALRVTGSISVSPTPGAATEAKQDTGNTSLSSIDNKLTSVSKSVFQTSALVSLITTPVPANASNGLTLIASTSQITKQIQIIEDIGEYMALYTGASGSEVLLCAAPLGGGEVNVNVPASTRISIKSLKASAINSNTFLIINILG